MGTTEFEQGEAHQKLSKEKAKWRNEMRAKCGECWVITENKKEKSNCKIWSVLEYHSKESQDVPMLPL